MKGNYKQLREVKAESISIKGGVLNFVSKFFPKKFRQNVAKKKNGGFTLMEIVVAVGIFGMVVLMISSIFMVAFFGHRRILALQSLQDNLRFSVEAMAREIRVGTGFSQIGPSEISFTSGTGLPIIYRLNNNSIERSDDGGLNFLPMTDPSITVSVLNFNFIVLNPQ